MDAALPFRINDADNHFVEPLDVYERYIEPRWRDKAVRWVKDAKGESVQLFAGRPSKTRLSRDSAPESEAELERLAARISPTPRGADVPGPAARARARVAGRRRRAACERAGLQPLDPRRGRHRADRLRLGLPARRGPAFPADYVAAQLQGMSDAEVRAIMRDDLARFLDLPPA